MRLTVLGGAGAWPSADQPCSGYLLEHDGYRLLVDPGYATFPALQRYLPAEQLDAVLVSHGHPDHCVDLNPLLRARALRPDPSPALPVYAPPDALDAVLALDRPGMLAAALDHRALVPQRPTTLGPYWIDSQPLPHFVPNYGLRVRAGSETLVYTGDSGPSTLVPQLAHAADVFVCDASYPHEVPPDDAAYLGSGTLAGQYAATAGVGRLVLAHVMPGVDPDQVVSAAAAGFDGPITVAAPGLTVDLRPA